MYCKVLFLVAGLGAGYALPQDLPPGSYEFEYEVKDEETGTEFNQRESREGNFTEGSYSVQLPDTRLMRVIYYIDEQSGFVAEVTYEGEAQYPPEEEPGQDSIFSKRPVNRIPSSPAGSTTNAFRNNQLTSPILRPPLQAVTNPRPRSRNQQRPSIQQPSFQTGFRTSSLNDQNSGFRTSSLNDQNSGFRTSSLNDQNSGFRTSSLNDQNSGFRTSSLNDQNSGFRTSNLNNQNSRLRTSSLNNRNSGFQRAIKVPSKSLESPLQNSRRTIFRPNEAASVNEEKVVPLSSVSSSEKDEKSVTENIQRGIFLTDEDPSLPTTHQQQRDSKSKEVDYLDDLDSAILNKNLPQIDLLQ